MAIKYEYESVCCKHYYIEVRDESQPLIYPTCNVCGQGEYELVQESELLNLE